LEKGLGNLKNGGLRDTKALNSISENTLEAQERVSFSIMEKKDFSSNGSREINADAKIGSKRSVNMRNLVISPIIKGILSKEAKR